MYSVHSINSMTVKSSHYYDCCYELKVTQSHLNLQSDLLYGNHSLSQATLMLSSKTAFSLRASLSVSLTDRSLCRPECGSEPVFCEDTRTAEPVSLISWQMVSEALWELSFGEAMDHSVAFFGTRGSLQRNTISVCCTISITLRWVLDMISGGFLSALSCSLSVSVSCTHTHTYRDTHTGTHTHTHTGTHAHRDTHTQGHTHTGTHTHRDTHTHTHTGTHTGTTHTGTEAALWIPHRIWKPC